jgi:hypothetical protein
MLRCPLHALRLPMEGALGRNAARLVFFRRRFYQRRQLHGKWDFAQPQAARGQAFIWLGRLSSGKRGTQLLILDRKLLVDATAELLSSGVHRMNGRTQEPTSARLVSRVLRRDEPMDGYTRTPRSAGRVATQWPLTERLVTPPRDGGVCQFPGVGRLAGATLPGARRTDWASGVLASIRQTLHTSSE